MMDLDEAIRHCEEVANKCKTGHFSERIKAMECAKEHRQLAEWLKELKAYKENTCGDAISRQAVLDLAEWFDLNRQHFIVANLIDEVENMPSVSPKPRTGRWIDDEFGSKCSCCGIYTHLDKFDRPMKFKCCSMCGAQMEVEE